MPQLFRPQADRVARTVLISLLVLPSVAIGLAYATMPSNDITNQSITHEQPAALTTSGAAPSSDENAETKP